MCTVLGGELRDERTRWGIKILLEVPRSTKKLKNVFIKIKVLLNINVLLNDRLPPINVLLNDRHPPSAIRPLRSAIRHPPSANSQPPHDEKNFKILGFFVQRWCWDFRLLATVALVTLRTGSRIRPKNGKYISV
jgi:hypothetical protein